MTKAPDPDGVFHSEAQYLNPGSFVLIYSFKVVAKGLLPTHEDQVVLIYRYTRARTDIHSNHSEVRQAGLPISEASMNPRTHLSAFLSALLLTALAGPNLTAQTSFGRIAGTVTDPSASPVAGAKVTFTNNDTQNTRSVETDANGYYVITNLPIGPYTVDVNLSGFQRKQQTGINVVADGRVTVDFKLQIGDVSQTVEVVSQAGETLNTVSGELSRVIDSKQVENLALNGGNYVQLMTLVPGAVVTNPDQFSVTTSLSATNQTINGNRSDSQNLTVDGAFNLVAGSNGSLMNNVNSNFIQEVKVQTSNASAEYGRTAGVAFNVVTKNGGNQGLVSQLQASPRNSSPRTLCALRFKNLCTEPSNLKHQKALGFT
jgi:hypothetical protein